MEEGRWKRESNRKDVAGNPTPDTRPSTLDTHSSPRPSVLIVDESEDSREVLKTALQRRGMDILEASRAAHGLALARQHQPRVIVLDLEIAEAAEQQLCDDFAQQSSHDPPTLVVIGTARRSHRSPTDVAADQLVSKPYHYGQLIRKIVELVT